ncbi:nitroreductase [Actinomycetota bacterium]|nr:nitroreductase [Actinomycetota bacterium]
MLETQKLDSLYQATFTRKSVRKYDAAPLSQEIQAEVLRIANSAVALDDTLAVAFRIVTPDQIKGMVSAKSPHYLAVYAAHGLESLTNAAFKLQQMDLWFSANGYGSCWLGMPNATQQVSACDGMPFFIMLAFGAPAEQAKRSSTSEFKRKALAEINTVVGLDDLLEPLRLAPSASNRQPWKVSGTADSLRLNIKKDGIISKAMFGSMRYCDAGIGLCHLWLSATHAGRFAGFGRESFAPDAPQSSAPELDAPQPDTPQGYEYFYTVTLG